MSFLENACDTVSEPQNVVQQLDTCKAIDIQISQYIATWRETPGIPVVWVGKSHGVPMIDLTGTVYPIYGRDGLWHWVNPTFGDHNMHPRLEDPQMGMLQWLQRLKSCSQYQFHCSLKRIVVTLEEIACLKPRNAHVIQRRWAKAFSEGNMG